MLAGEAAGAIGARATLVALAAVTVCAPMTVLRSPIRRLHDLTDELTPPDHPRDLADKRPAT